MDIFNLLTKIEEGSSSMLAVLATILNSDPWRIMLHINVVQCYCVLKYIPGFQFAHY